MTNTPIHDAATLLESVAERSLRLASDDLMSPWGALATRTTLVATLLTGSQQPIIPRSSGTIHEDLREALRLLTSTGPTESVPLGDLTAARRWLGELLAEVPEPTP